MGKRANIARTRRAAETQVWQGQATDLRAAGLIPSGAGPQEARRFTEAPGKHHSRFGVAWVVFGCFALSGLSIQGAWALAWLIPIGALIALVHAVSVNAEAGMTDAQRARVVIQKQVFATAVWSGGRCTWCSSVVPHRDADGGRQAPSDFHVAELIAEVDRRVAAY